MPEEVASGVVVGSLNGPDRLLINDGKGHLTVATDVFAGTETPGTLGLALGDLDNDGRMDVVQAQGEHPTAVQERVFLGKGLQPDTAPPSVSLVKATVREGITVVRARVHDRKSPTVPTDWKRVDLEWTDATGPHIVPMRWYGEFLWSAEVRGDRPWSRLGDPDVSDSGG